MAKEKELKPGDVIYNKKGLNVFLQYGGRVGIDARDTTYLNEVDLSELMIALVPYANKVPVHSHDHSGSGMRKTDTEENRKFWDSISEGAIEAKFIK